jgi:hypothetical protein
MYWPGLGTGVRWFAIAVAAAVSHWAAVSAVGGW